MTEEDINALVALSKYRRLTSFQLQRVAYASRSTAERRLRLLTKAGYLQRLQAPAAHRGTPPFVYSLMSMGTEAVADILGEPRGQGGGSITRKKLDGHVFHYLAVNDFWIDLEQELGQLPHVQLDGFVPYHYREKKPWSRRAVPVIQDSVPSSAAGGRAFLLEPDAAFGLDVHGTKMLMLVEIDRTGTIVGTSEHSFSRKIIKYITYLYSGVFRKLYRRLFLMESDGDYTAFCLLSVTTTEARMRGITNAIPKELEFRNRMFYTSTFGRLERDGILSSEWLDGAGEGMVFKDRFLS